MLRPGQITLTLVVVIPESSVETPENDYILTTRVIIFQRVPKSNRSLRKIFTDAWVGGRGASK